ncbi:hypothetical protein [Mongoliimonas terrestris]|uniref:hypothetical protein n=1 Tax=Mongoliimonas terrestris TaxID=1709001 RepID=UPI000AF962A8|nr:hypothetical protein [Mongoliimonas terrestris]
MSYPISEAAFLAGVPVDQLKSLRNRDQLPFLSPGAENYDRERLDGRTKREWARFIAEDCVLLAVARRLGEQVGYAEGLPPSTTAKIVDNNRTAILKAAKNPGWDVWIGYSAGDFGFNLAGTISDVAEKIAERENEALAEGRPAPVRAFLVNVSQVVREVRARAAEAKIDFTL